MNLSNRVIRSKYQYNSPSLEVKEAEIYGRNQEQDSSFRYVRHMPVHSPVTSLLKCEVANRARSANSDLWLRKNSAFTASRSSEKSLDQTTQIHIENMRRNLEYRLQAAKARGDQNLLHQLEMESKQLAFQR
ncbi:hypothetical protein Cri9333_4654 [Crinalium epipsammum PCC 9333]|uniref:Uncharacterized protein n=1 Tax=Crinalium epipsammum PCC 9333 TaxID=1173022 RepID=K9W503_9CYAN|nr:hypothetical protein [Crinalium epipsammum]AFZ15433.1 hypothetical protein Cri9333_4654 [Crinalium epipsammum PCC 9333]